MLKDEALAIFIGVPDPKVPELFGMTTLKFWPEKLDMRRADRVRGAAMRLGYPIPDRLRHSYYDEDGKLVESDPVGRKWESTR